MGYIDVDPIKNPIAALEALQHMNPLIMMQKMQLMRAQSDVKADRKLYVGNLPSNTTTSEV
jgi:splicing factor U2AF subunit